MRDVALVWFVARIVAPYVTRFGTEAQIERYIPGAVSGDTILAVAMTEPDAGEISLRDPCR